MYYIDNKLYDLMKLHPSEVSHTLPLRQLSGFEAKIYGAWKEILDKTRYMDNGTPKYKMVKFRCPHIGVMTKSQGGSFPRSVTIHDDTGSHRVVWCTNAIPQPNGGFEFRPNGYKYEKATFEKDPQKDIEEILWHVCFSSLRNQKTTIKVGEKYIDKAKLYVVDTEREADSYLNEQSKSGAAIYYLTQSFQHFSDEKFINFMCNLYEFNRPETLSNSVKREMLLKSIIKADQRDDPEKNSLYFLSCVQNYQEGDAYTKMCILVQQAFDRTLIGFDQPTLKVYLRGAGNTMLDKWYTVAPSDFPRWKKAFAKWLLGHPEKAEILEAGIEERPIEQKPTRTFYIPTPITEDFFLKKVSEGGMDWGEMRALINLLPGINVEATKTKMTREEGANILISYFVKEGRTIDPTWMRDTPEVPEK